MADTNLTRSITPGLSARRLAINLALQAGGAVDVQSCEIAGPDFLNRTSFRGERRIDEVFVGRLAEALADLVTTLPSGAHMLSKPEFLLELPGAILSGVRVLVAEGSKDARNVIVRFKEFMGGITMLMKPDVGGAEEQTLTYADNLAISALMDICIPIMNFCRSAELARMDGGEHASRMVEDKVREFEFHTELLKRYLANQKAAENEAESRGVRQAPTPHPMLTVPRGAMG